MLYAKCIKVKGSDNDDHVNGGRSGGVMMSTKVDTFMLHQKYEKTGLFHWISETKLLNFKLNNWCWIHDSCNLTYGIKYTPVLCTFGVSSTCEFKVVARSLEEDEKKYPRKECNIARIQKSKQELFHHVKANFAGSHRLTSHVKSALHGSSHMCTTAVLLHHYDLST